jgi:hypothetical protein
MDAKAGTHTGTYRVPDGQNCVIPSQCAICWDLYNAAPELLAALKAQTDEMEAMLSRHMESHGERCEWCPPLLEVGRAARAAILKAEGPDLLALVSAQLRGEAEHDTDEDGVHWSGEHYRGRKGGMSGNCDGCRWSDAAYAAILKAEGAQ